MNKNQEGNIRMVSHIEILPGFHEKQIRLEKLLQDNNQVWAIELCQGIIDKIEKENLQSTQRLNYYDQIIRIWQNHIRRLVGNFVENWPFIYTAYYYLFDIFLILKDHDRITDAGIRLAKNLIRIQFATKSQIANLLEDLAILTYQANNFRKAIQLILLAVYFRGNYKKNKYFDISFSKLDIILKKLAPNERSLLLDSLLMNTFEEFFVDLIESDAENQTDLYGIQIDCFRFRWNIIKQ